MRAAFQSYFAPKTLPAVFWTFFCLAILEMSVVHILVHKIDNPTVRAWVHGVLVVSDLSILQLLFMALYRLKDSYVRMEDGMLKIKFGRKRQLDIPFAAIASITPMEFMQTEPGAVKISLIESPKLRIELKEPIQNVRIIHLWVKDEDLQPILLRFSTH